MCARKKYFYLSFGFEPISTHRILHWYLFSPICIFPCAWYPLLPVLKSFLFRMKSCFSPFNCIVTKFVSLMTNSHHFNQLRFISLFIFTIPKSILQVVGTTNNPERTFCRREILDFIFFPQKRGVCGKTFRYLHLVTGSNSTHRIITVHTFNNGKTLTYSNQRLFLNMFIATFTFKTNQFISFSYFLPFFSPTTFCRSMKFPEAFCFLFVHWNNILGRQQNISYV